ncbi:MAG TPA: TIGR03905 family TSCPD domain-containing protein [Thermodesulfobacteriota bacterium]|nr:TIGR03905 family TSCPD domain-containing protein [Thermodesulfobacteriota bacterium]
MKKRFKPTGICPKEIHLDIEGGILKQLSFLGGGCRGNSHLICKILQGKRIEELIPLLKGIPCREGTSCPDQVAKALELDQKEGLPTAEMNILTVEEQWERIGVFSGIRGDLQNLKKVLGQLSGKKFDRLICLGGLVGEGFFRDEIFFELDKAKVILLEDPSDLRIRESKEVSNPGSQFPSQLPALLEFRLGKLRGIAFHGGAMEEIPGYSEYAKYGADINAIIYLSNYLRDEYVSPAFETVAKQFWANLYIFNHTRDPLYKSLPNRHFVNVGEIKPLEGNKGTYAVLEAKGEQLVVEFREIEG